MSEVICWGFNPGQWMVKNSLDGVNGKMQIAPPFPAVIAPWAKMDDLGLSKGAKVLEATVNGSRYQGGATVQYSPLAMRQMASGRLDIDSPLYPALAQMSAQHVSMHKRANGTLPRVLIVTALPVGWMSPDAEAAMRIHLRSGLAGVVEVVDVLVKSEPAAVVLHEMITDTGDIRADQTALAEGLVCVADIGGSTLNRAVLNRLQPLPGQSDSPYLGSLTAIESLRQRRGLHQITDAETQLLAALKAPGKDPLADSIHREYRDAVIANLQQAWKGLHPLAYLVAGGTALWVGDAIVKAFGSKVCVTTKPQQTIATGLYRFGRRQLARKAKAAR